MVLPGMTVPGSSYSVDADSVAGYVILYRDGVEIARLTEPQSELLRPILQRAEAVVSSGFGDMILRVPG